MKDVYEIHKYQNGQFQYVVARTNKHSEEKVKTDVEKMNKMLSEEFKSQGLSYTFAVGTMADYMKNASRNRQRRQKSTSESSFFA